MRSCSKKNELDRTNPGNEQDRSELRSPDDQLVVRVELLANNRVERSELRLQVLVPSDRGDLVVASTGGDAASIDEREAHGVLSRRLPRIGRHNSRLDRAIIAMPSVVFWGVDVALNASRGVFTQPWPISNVQSAQLLPTREIKRSPWGVLGHTYGCAIRRHFLPESGFGATTSVPDRRRRCRQVGGQLTHGSCLAKAGPCHRRTWPFTANSSLFIPPIDQLAMAATGRQ